MSTFKRETVNTNRSESSLWNSKIYKLISFSKSVLNNNLLTLYS